ncbi:HD domain-containing protein [Virgibacillus doumboii]|uniref:HD domain-containing protein n=1 Tax=Virgibacillus doumboii TaxID=2697503 RepID=UPI0013E02FE4|nr:HD domain-containing protein [Virgibacillus doumboii]
MNNQEKLTAIRVYVYDIFNDDATGHDFFHMKRVANTAKAIAEYEKADIFICEAAAWIHDVGDGKLFSDSEKELEKLEEFLHSLNCTSQQIDYIKTAAKDVSFSKGKTPVTLEGKIVQDADRLDALGAIGIARSFAFGGSNGQLIWHDSNHNNTSVQHFYDKLLKLKNMMNTDTAKQIAEERHRFMEKFLEQFFKEW